MRKTISIWSFITLDMIVEKPVRILSLHYHELIG